MAYINKTHKYRENHTDEKTKLRKKIYSSVTWRTLQASYIARFPLCYLCKQEGIIKSADCVHHIITFVDKPDPYKYAYDEKNLVSLCTYHHSKMHAEHNESSLYFLYHTDDNTDNTDYYF